MWHVICYDVREDRRRNRIARLLDDVGDRVQYSVFEVDLESEQLDRLIESIRKEMDLQEDVVHCFAVCGACQDKSRVCGQGSAFEKDFVWIV